MKAKTIFRKGLGNIFTAGATLSMGFLSFIGISVLTAGLAPATSLALGGIAFVLAAAYESQVNGEGVNSALRRIFDPNRLKKGLVANFLNKLYEEDAKVAKKKAVSEELAKKEAELQQYGEKTRENTQEIKNLKKRIAVLQEHKKYLEKVGEQFAYAENRFFQDYKAQKQYIQQLQEYLRYLEKRKKAHLIFFESKARDEWQIKIKTQRELFKKAKARLRYMQLFFLRNLLNAQATTEQTELEKAASALLGNQNGEALKNRMWWRGGFITGSWLLCLGLGVSSGLATLTSMSAAIAQISTVHSGILTFALGFFPPAVLITISTIAAIGYTLLIYQGISDMIQDFSENWREQFDKRPEESRTDHVIRCVGIGIAIALGILATLATAATWWSYVKDGAALIGLGEKIASIIRSVTVVLFVVPNFVFAAQNSVESVEKISKSNYGELAKGLWKDIKDAADKENIIQLINPFRLVEKLISYTAKTFMFLGHIFSIGVSSDNIPNIPPIATSIVAAGSEALTDINYLPNDDHGHVHESILLTAIFTPVNIVVGILKFFSSSWDYVFSGFKDAKKSFGYATSLSADNEPAPTMRQLSFKWEGQQVLVACDKTIERLKNKKNDGLAQAKVKAAQGIKTKVMLNMDNKNISLPDEKAPLNKIQNIPNITTKTQQNKEESSEKTSLLNSDDEKTLAAHRNSWGRFWQSSPACACLEIKAACKQYVEAQHIPGAMVNS